MSDILSNFFQDGTLIVRDENQRKTLINESLGCTEIMKDKETRDSFSFKGNSEVQLFIIWYINRNFERAIKKSLHDKTHNQHTVPNFLNVSLAKNFDTAGLFKFRDKEIKFNKGNQTVKAVYSYETGEWELSSTKNKDISVFENIYDIKDSSYSDKLIECFLATFENDAAPIISRICGNVEKQEISFSERVILSCYALLQCSRTDSWKNSIENAINDITDISLKMSTLTAEEAYKNIVSQLGESFSSFGKFVLESLQLETLNLIFARNWAFLHAPQGLVTSLYPLGSFDLDVDCMFSGSLLLPDHLMLPLGRNIVWVLSSPNPSIKDLKKFGLILSTEENQFVNEIFSLRNNELYCHPDDVTSIIDFLYRTELLEVYSEFGTPLSFTDLDLTHIKSSEQLLKIIPERWRG